MRKGQRVRGVWTLHLASQMALLPSRSAWVGDVSLFEANVPLLEHLAACEDGGLGVERVEDGLDDEEVAPPVQQPTHLLRVRLHQLVERRVPKHRGASSFKKHIRYLYGKRAGEKGGKDREGKVAVTE